MLMQTAVLNNQALLSALPSLAPPQVFATGTILTLRMRGHSRTAGQDYYAPAIVLNQHMPNGEIETMVFDATVGTHYDAAYPIRELGVRGEGSERQMYELQSNVGEVLFSPTQFNDMMFAVGELQSLVSTLLQRVHELEGALK